MQVAQIKDRNQVEDFKQVSLFVPEEEARAANTDPDFFFNDDLIGLKMVEGEVELGVVVDVIEMPGQNLLEVKGEGGHVFHVPFAEKLIGDIDLDEGIIVVDLPEGLVDLNRESQERA